MENFFSRYKNPLVLMAVLFIQVIALATQVKRPESGKAAGSGSTRLIRVWTVTAITPFERMLVGTGHFFRDTWHNYIDLHDVRKQNRELQDELTRLRLEQARLRNEADQSQRLRALLDFKERYAARTVAAQVIGTSGSDLTRAIQIDKGSHAGVKAGMAVITPDGIVGKVREVFPFSSQVLLISDRESGAGVILQGSRLHGILHGSPQGFLQVNDVMSDEKVDVGEQVITSGGDGVYPKGLPAGTVTYSGPDPEGGPFLAVRIKPAARLDKLEEILVVTEIAEAGGSSAENSAPRRAADILSERLPSVPKTADANAAAGGTSVTNPPGANRNPVPPAAPTTSGVKKVEGAKPSATPTPTPTSTPTPTPTASPSPKKKASPKTTPTPVDDAAPGATPDGNTSRPKAQPSPTGNAEKPPR